MDRIVISVTSLSKENWVTIYQFIRSILIDDTLESKTNAFNRIRDIATISLERKISKVLDVFKLDDTIIKESDLENLTKDTAFSLIYEKEDDTEDFTELVPFILLQEEFKKRISLGINIEKLDLEKQGNYAFRCSDFFILYKDMSPKHGYNSIYFINEKKKNKIGEIVLFSSNHITRLKGKGNKTYLGKSSRRFLPLVFINQDNYNSVFGYKSDCSEEQRFIIESFSKMQKDFEKSKYSSLLGIDKDFIKKNDDTIFGKWLESGFFYSIIDELDSFRIPGVRNTIQVIKHNIVELVQNIIFHAHKKGMLYCVFDKKVNIPKKCQQNIPGFADYSDNFRFLRIGIYDYSNTGIIDTFSSLEKDVERSHLALTDFFDTKSVLTANLTRPEVRFAAHLGIKTFVKSIIRHKGYFSVETNVSYGCKGNKKQLETHLDGDHLSLSPEEDILFANGTHYEIVFPINPLEITIRPVIPLQRTSLLADHFRQSLDAFNSGEVLRSCKFPEKIIEQLVTCQSKEEQKRLIINLGNSLIENKQEKKEVVFDLLNNKLDYNHVFKILSYIQLNNLDGFEKIILVNTKDDFIDHIHSLLEYFKTSEDNSFWSKKNAIIIISENLNAQIIWGDTRNDFEYVNSELLKIYFLNFFALKDAKDKSKSFLNIKYELKKEIKEITNKFLYPWDILINNAQNQSPFEQFLTQLIKRKIISKELGFLVNHENTYIGNKIIVRNYYEADMMFQNNFFTERFAFIIANNIRQAINEQNNLKRNIVIIGYKFYSEQLLKAIKRALKYDFDNVYLVVANIDNDSNDYSNYFNFDIDGDGSYNKREVLKQPDTFYFTTVVPIGSTLSTNDKVIAFFNYWFEQKSKKKFTCEFIYNHCVIVVRDNTGNVVSPLECERKWKEKGIDLSKRIIHTYYHNAKKVHYTVQVAYAEDNKKNNWIKRLNDDTSFTNNWWDEKYVNFTENSSINSQNLMGFPRVNEDENQHKDELGRLYNFRNHIIKGHIDVLNCHHKYYVDTETFIRKNIRIFSEWLQNLKNSNKGKTIFNLERLNIIITPSAERESDLVFAVNNYLFDGNALIVYLEVKNWRNNIIHKLSFLKDLPSQSVRYHYVDQALLTGETYHKTKSYLFSILGIPKIVTFDSIITVVNRLSFTKNIEITDDVKHNLYTYVHLHYPSSKMDEDDCELCKLSKYYKKLASRTVLDSCLGIIDKNLRKITLLRKNEIERNNHKLTKRNFLRLVITHELYYVISKSARTDNEDINFDNSSEAVIRKLNSIYSQLCNTSTPIEKPSEQYSIDDLINKWYNKDLFMDDRSLWCYYNNKLETDKRISFLKVISSPPLSKYIIIRKYAHEKLLEELHNIFLKNEPYKYDDLKIVKSILKSLSFLKSNALVRKDVIVGIWTVLNKVLENLDEEKDMVNFFIKISIPNQINKLDNIKENCSENKVLAKNFQTELMHDKESMNKVNIVKDFSRDVQFFIKNTIVDDEAKATYLGELLRKGEEMMEFETISISETKLSLQNKSSDNKLFNAFAGFDLIEKEYTKFLVWVFYDNTTIIRKTLENFSKEIYKDKVISECFYKINGNNLELFDMPLFEKSIDKLKKAINKKINNEYYYSSFKPYFLYNGDEIDYHEKLIFVTYAKLLLKDINNKNKKEIETDTISLLRVFSRIMGADAAFWTLKKRVFYGSKDTKCYVIFHFGLDDDIEQGKLTDDYFTSNVFLRKWRGKYPFVSKYKIDSIYAEKEKLKAYSLAIFYITNNDESIRNQNTPSNESYKDIVSSITFLFHDNSLNKSEEEKEKTFRVQVQESGRLLLLLKSEIEEYVVGYLIKDKAIDLWEQKYWSARRFEKIYANNAHIFKSVYDEMEEFETLNNTQINNLVNTWFFLSNETISFLYSDIEKHYDNNGHFLDLFSRKIIDDQNTLGNTFNDSFISILCALLRKRWGDSIKDDNGKTVRNQILINNCDIFHFKIRKTLSNARISCNKHLIRTFIAQCLHNSLSKINEHGHRGEGEIKRIYITIKPRSITIKDSYKIEIYNEKEKQKAKIEFEKKKQYIEKMICDEYSSTTLTSLQGLVNYMRKEKYKFSCDYGFNGDNNFQITINFN